MGRALKLHSLLSITLFKWIHFARILEGTYSENEEGIRMVEMDKGADKGK